MNNRENNNQNMENHQGVNQNYNQQNNNQNYNQQNSNNQNYSQQNVNNQNFYNQGYNKNYNANQGYQQSDNQYLNDENSIADDMKKLGSEFAKVGGRAIKSGINAGVEAMNNRNVPRRTRKTQSGVLFALVCKIIGYVMFAVAVILFFSIIFSTPTINDTYGLGAGINSRLAGMSFSIAFIVAILISTIGVVFLGVSHIITLLNISNVKKDQLIDLLIDSNEMAFYQNELLERE